MLPGGQCRLDRFGFGCLSTVKNPIVHPLPLFGPKGPPSVKKRVGRPKKPREPQSDAVEALAILKKKKQEKAAAQEAAARLKSDKTRYIAVKLTVIDRVTCSKTMTVTMQSFWTCETARSSLKSLKQFASCPRCIKNKK